MERLQKIIAASGLTSRRGAEALIIEGRVTVNGKRITVLGSQADPETDHIRVNNVALAAPQRTTYLFNKPKGVVCSRKRQDKEKIISDFLPASPVVYPVGRLDKESEGLILLTNDGLLAHHLAHPSFGHQKEYLVIVRADKDLPLLPIETISKKLEKGVKLGDGKAIADSVKFVEKQKDSLVLKITVHEGRTHLIRRMCATLGLDVLRLVRIRIDHLTISRLSSGQYRRLNTQEVSKLHAA